MFKEFATCDSRDWVFVLPMLIIDYNNLKYRTIGLILAQAVKYYSSVVLKHCNIPNIKIKYKVADNEHKIVFNKGYLSNQSTEMFTKVKINKTLPPTYQLQDYNGKSIAVCFYSEEINKANDYLVEKIMRKNGNRVLVKWLRFDSFHNSWLKASNIEKQI